jgi:hypothetical protein
MLGGLFGGVDAALRDPSREVEVRACPVAHTIVRCGRLVDVPGGRSYLEFLQAAQAAPGPIAREDAALVLARALAFPPAEGESVVFAAGGAGPGAPPRGGDWAEMFGQLRAVAAAATAA